jgi:hypothetical protein
VILGLLAAASGAAAWQEPQQVPGSERDSPLGLPTLDVDGRGAALATWVRRFEGEQQVRGTATRLPGGAWQPGPPVHDPMSPETLRLYGQTRAVLLALRPRSPRIPQDVDVRVRFGRSDGTFEPSRLLARGPVSDGAIDASATGRVVAAWATGRAGPTVVRAAVRPAGKSFGSVRTLSPTQARHPSVAVSAGGDIVVAWWRRTGRGPRIEARIRRVGGDWGSVLDIARVPRGVARSVAAADAVGRFVVGWQAHVISSGGGDEGVVAGYAVRGLTGGWRARTLADTPNGGLFEHGRVDAGYLAVNRPLVVWTVPVEGRHRVRVARITGATLSGIDTLAGPRGLSGGAPDLSIAPGRRAIVAWLETGEQIEEVPPVVDHAVVSVRRDDGRFGDGVLLSAADRQAGEPRAAYGPRDEALVSWRERLAATEWATFAAAGP